MVWLILYVGGEQLLDRFLLSSKVKLTNSQVFTNDAKCIILKCVEFLMEEKDSLKKLHTSLFYIDGKYYNISNRMTGIHYVSDVTQLHNIEIIIFPYYRYFLDNGSNIINLIKVLKSLDTYHYFISYFGLLVIYLIMINQKYISLKNFL